MQKILKKLFNKSIERSTDHLQNPYVAGAAGKKAWDDRYMNMSKALRNWQFAFGASMVVLIIAIGVMAKIAIESKVQPFVVETTQGMPVAIQAMQSISSKDQKLINYAIDQFIINARSVISDSQAEKAMMDKVYAYSANNTMVFLTDYYKTHNPFVLASDYTVSVDIVHALPISKNTWQVTWDEEKRNASSGVSMGTTRWTADLTYQLSDVDQQQMANNPFGLYITQVSWTPSQLA